ncbi:hypothetical protein DVH24_000661 [Malus domestica]|uniref:Uncharacterized protein n=1 Tax=Malus domestica TaxID=3750 RepID=A0A498J5C0_MALDO|nr:hypothetical protein DVH24_000661 [Malus domestica]
MAGYLHILHRYTATWQPSTTSLGFLEDVGPLLSMQMGGQTLEGLFQVFNSYAEELLPRAANEVSPLNQVAYKDDYVEDHQIGKTGILSKESGRGGLPAR